MKLQIPTLMILLPLYVLTLILVATTLFLTMILGPSIQMILGGVVAKEDGSSHEAQPLETSEGLPEFFFNALGELGLWGDVTALPVLFLALGGVRFVVQSLYQGGWEWMGERECLRVRKTLMRAYLNRHSMVHEESPREESPKMVSSRLSSEDREQVSVGDVGVSSQKEDDPTSDKRAISKSNSFSESSSATESSLFTLHSEYSKNYVLWLWGEIPYQIAQALMLLALMAYMLPTLTLAVVMGIFPVVACGLYFTQKIRRKAQQELDVISQMSQWFEQRLGAVSTIKHRRSEPYEMAALACKLDDLLLKQRQTRKAQAQSSPVGEFLFFIVICVVFYAVLRWRSYLTLSPAVLITYIAAMVYLSEGWQKIARTLAMLAPALAARRIIRQRKKTWCQSAQYRGALDGDHSPSDKGRPAATAREANSHDSALPSGLCVEVLGVSLRRGNREIFGGVSYRFDFGKFYTIRGRSGLGKSTLLRVLAGELSPDQGEVRWCEKWRPGDDQLAVEPFHDRPGSPHMVYVPQDFTPIPLPWGLAVAFPHTSYDAVRVWQALDQVQLSAVLKQKNVFLDEMPGAVGLSGGEQQRLFLARVFYHRPAIILADEFTSALDESSEQKILTSLRELIDRHSCCVITIAHRRNVWEAADEVVDLAELIADHRENNSTAR